MARCSYRKATPAERADYQGIYPLAGWATHNGVTLAVEDLRCWPKGDPQYEVMAPAGHLFGVNGTHTLLCDNLADVRDRVTCDVVEPCATDCSCKPRTPTPSEG